MDFLKLAKKRYACRKYLSRQVEPEKLELILEAGRVSGLNMQIHSVSRPSDAAASIMWSVTIDASMSEMFLPSYLRVHASEVSAQTMTAVGAPKSRVQRARRSMPSFDCTTTSRWGWRLAPVGEAVREEFALPANVEPVNILLIGYGDGPAADPNRHDTLRKPLSATVFHERF